jgi:hypothetical protein
MKILNIFFLRRTDFKFLSQMGCDLRFFNFFYARPLRLFASSAGDLHVPLLMLTQAVSRTSCLLL